MRPELHENKVENLESMKGINLGFLTRTKTEQLFFFSLLLYFLFLFFFSLSSSHPFTLSSNPLPSSHDQPLFQPNSVVPSLGETPPDQPSRLAPRSGPGAAPVDAKKLVHPTHRLHAFPMHSPTKP